MASQTNALLHALYRCSGEQNVSQLTVLLPGDGSPLSGPTGALGLD